MIRRSFRGRSGGKTPPACFCRGLAGGHLGPSATDTVTDYERRAIKKPTEPGRLGGLDFYRQSGDASIAEVETWKIVTESVTDLSTPSQHTQHCSTPAALPALALSLDRAAGKKTTKAHPADFTSRYGRFPGGDGPEQGSSQMPCPREGNNAKVTTSIRGQAQMSHCVIKQDMVDRVHKSLGLTRVPARQAFAESGTMGKEPFITYLSESPAIEASNVNQSDQRGDGTESPPEGGAGISGVEQIPAAGANDLVVRQAA